MAEFHWREPEEYELAFREIAIADFVPRWNFGYRRLHRMGGAVEAIANGKERTDRSREEGEQKGRMTSSGCKDISFGTNIDGNAKPTGYSNGLTLALAVVICGMISTASYEQVNLRDRGCGNLITFCEYLLVVAMDGHFFVSNSRKVPMPYHVVVLVGFLGYSLLCNFALKMALPVTVLLILKNGGMVADVCLGYLVLGRRYKWVQILAIVAVTCGISVAAIAAKKTYEEDDNEGGVGGATEGMLGSITSSSLGLLLIVCALLVRATSGVSQEIVLQRFNGSVQAELRIWRTILGLPILCLFGWSNIAEHAVAWIDHEPQIQVMSGTRIPMIWMFMICNMIFDYATKLLVGRLIFRTSALTTSLVLIIMRFASIVFSSCYVNAPPYPPAWMWAGCVVMVLGTVTYVYTGASGTGKTKKKEE